MRHYELHKMCDGVFLVATTHKTIGVIAQGDLKTDRSGSLTITGRHWVVVGFEDYRFKTAESAADALFYAFDNFQDSAVEILVVSRLESLAPIYANLARRSKDQTVCRLSKNLRRELRENKADYHESLRCAGVSKYVH